MKSVYLVVKNSDEAKELKKRIPQRKREEIDFVLAEEGSTSISAARTLLALGGRPVGLVVDAGTTDETQIATQRETLTALLENASARLPSRAFIAIPSLQEVFAAHTPVNKIPLIQEIIRFVEDQTARLATPQLSSAR